MLTRIVTDSTADFTDGAAEGAGITVVPLLVTFGNESFLDKEQLSTADFYQRLRTDPSPPTTAAPSIESFERAYRALLEQADNVISVHISAKLSATWSVARAAADSVAPDRIAVVDSGQTTMCLGWQALRAAELGQQDVFPGLIVEAVQQMAATQRAYFTLETLHYLERGGRIGKAQAFVGTVLNVKPVLLCADGEVLPVERVRTRRRALERIADIVAALPGVERLGVLHGGDPQAQTALVELIAARLPGLSPELAQIGAVLGVHTGPGVVGLACTLGA